MAGLARIIDIEASDEAPRDPFGALALAVEDLRRGGDFAAKLRILAECLFQPPLGSAAQALMRACDLDGWIAACGSNWRRNALYPTLTWPTDERIELGLGLALIEDAARRPSRALDFVDEFYCIDGDAPVRLQHFVEEVIVPFHAHFREFLMRRRMDGAPLGAGVVVCGDDELLMGALCEALTQHAYEVHRIAACAPGAPDAFLGACPPSEQIATAIVVLGATDVEARWLRRPAPGAASPGLTSLALLVGRLGARRVRALASAEIHADWSACLSPPLLVEPEPTGEWKAGLLDRLSRGSRLPHAGAA